MNEERVKLHGHQANNSAMKKLRAMPPDDQGQILARNPR